MPAEIDEQRTETNTPQEVEQAVAAFDAIENRLLRSVINALPIAILIATMLYTAATWALNGVFAAGGMAGLTTGLATITSILLARELYRQFPETLLQVWQRDLLRPPDAQYDPTKTAAQFVEYVTQSRQQANSRLGLIFSAALLALAMMVLPPFAGRTAAIWISELRASLVGMTLSLLIRLTFYAGSFLGGLILWRIVVIAHRVHVLGREFDFELLLGHPDGCGGLRPLGDLCMRIAYILSPQLLLIGGWLFYLTIAQDRPIPQPLLGTVPTLRALVVPLAILTVVGFFQPLTAVHDAMLRAKSRLQDELDGISQQIHSLGSDLLTKANALSAEQGVDIEEKLDFLARVYDRNSHVPTWPISYRHLWQLGSTQLAPAIGLVVSGIGVLGGILDRV